ncbi:LysR family transcriptional regulator [Sesbania bispinosa]|nr:LysR family transcriptional regulator [Sesbania bispinosa]
MAAAVTPGHWATNARRKRGLRWRMAEQVALLQQRRGRRWWLREQKGEDEGALYGRAKMECEVV